MEIKSLLNPRYIFYGLSIIISRGLELGIMFFAAHYLTKEIYGEMEYYKKVLELGGVFLSFGFPTMLLTYTRSDRSKVYMLLFATIFILILSVITYPLLLFLEWNRLWLSFIFYAIFFTGGVYPLYVLVKKGSNWASAYKTIISFAFYTGILFYVLYSNTPEKAFIQVAKWLAIPGGVWLINEWIRNHINWVFVKRYFKHFVKLIYGSITLLLNNFSNLMFLYTDIFIIKLLSAQPHIQIAEYSFSLNAANILMLIPLTLVQVDIEKIKKNNLYFGELQKKILILVLIGIIILIPFYFILIKHFYAKFSNTLLLFVLILLAKFFQSQGVLYGAILLINKKYNINLFVNLFMIFINIGLSYMLFQLFDLMGVAIASAISLGIRYVLLKIFLNKIYKESNG